MGNTFQPETKFSKVHIERIAEVIKVAFQSHQDLRTHDDNNLTIDDFLRVYGRNDFIASVSSGAFKEGLKLMFAPKPRKQTKEALIKKTCNKIHQLMVDNENFIRLHIEMKVADAKRVISMILPQQDVEIVEKASVPREFELDTSTRQSVIDWVERVQKLLNDVNVASEYKEFFKFGVKDDVYQEALKLVTVDEVLNK